MKKEELRAIVQENRDSHRRQFERALDGFRARVITELESRLAGARAGRRIDVTIHLPQPEDHTYDYDRILEMLHFEVEDIIELDEHDFAQYVHDDWGDTLRRVEPRNAERHRPP